jgi:DNA-binding NarL/FixJ family response regulator
MNGCPRRRVSCPAGHHADGMMIPAALDATLTRESFHSVAGARPMGGVMGQLLTHDVVHVPETPLDHGHGSGLRILLVDDEPAGLTELQTVLNDRDITIVGSTDSGEHALDLARILDPDVAVIRWSLRRFGGALTARLMQWHAPNVTPVLLVDVEDLDELDGSELETTSIRCDTTPSELRATLQRMLTGIGPRVTHPPAEASSIRRQLRDPSLTPAQRRHPSAKQAALAGREIRFNPKRRSHDGHT